MQDFIQYILEGEDDDHVNGPYEEKCHACLINYNYIVKLETQDVDSTFIIKKKLKERGIGTSLNTKRQSGSVIGRDGRKLLDFFQDLSYRQYWNITEKYRYDFGMYGYTMDDNFFTAKCAGKIKGRVCC